MTSPTILLYSASPSYFSQIVRLALVEMGLPFDVREIDIHGRLDQLEPEYAAINPALTVPALRRGDELVPGSDRILAFLDAAYPERSLQGATPMARERCAFWIKTFYSFPIEYLTFSTLLKRIPGMGLGFRWKTGQMLKRMNAVIQRHPELAATFEAKRALLERRRQDLLAPGTYDAAYSAYKLLIDELGRSLENGGWLAGPQYSGADVVATCVLARLSMIGSLEAATSVGAIASYWNAVCDRPSFEAADLWDKPRYRRIFQELFGLV